MHRVPLVLAIVIFIMQLYVTIFLLIASPESVRGEFCCSLWLNALFIIVPIIKIVIKKISLKREKKELEKMLIL